MWASGWEGHTVEHYWRLEEWPEVPESKVRRLEIGLGNY